MLSSIEVQHRLFITHVCVMRHFFICASTWTCVIIEQLVFLSVLAGGRTCGRNMQTAKLIPETSCALRYRLESGPITTQRRLPATHAKTTPLLSLVKHSVAKLHQAAELAKVASPT